MLQYIRIINIFVASFVGFQIAVYAYVVLRSFTCPSKPELTPCGRVVSIAIVTQGRQ